MNATMAGPGVRVGVGDGQRVGQLETGRSLIREMNADRNKITTQSAGVRG